MPCKHLKVDFTGSPHAKSKRALESITTQWSILCEKIILRKGSAISNVRNKCENEAFYTKICFQKGVNIVLEGVDLSLTGLCWKLLVHIQLDTPHYSQFMNCIVEVKFIFVTETLLKSISWWSCSLYSI